MTSRALQSIILQMRDATDRCLGVVDESGNVLACTELGLIGTTLAGFSGLQAESADQIIVSGKYTIKAFGAADSVPMNAVFVEGTDANARCLCVMACVAFQETKANHEEKYNKTIFIKNIICDNILPGEIYGRAKDLHFEIEAPRIVFLIRQVGASDGAALEAVHSIASDSSKDFILNVNENDIVFIKNFAGDDAMSYSLQVAQKIQTGLQNQLNLSVVIGISTVAEQLRDLADRYKEAQVAIDIGKVFYSEDSIIHYDNLGIGRLIYQLPTKLCQMFLKEVFKRESIESLDQDTIITIDKFFENNLNVSETSRKLFVHRNTLVYRLEKIKKLTGLDLREFDQAIIFKVAMMVNKYLKSQRNN